MSTQQDMKSVILANNVSLVLFLARPILKKKDLSLQLLEHRKMR